MVSLALCLSGLYKPWYARQMEPKGHPSLVIQQVIQLGCRFLIYFAPHGVYIK